LICAVLSCGAVELHPTQVRVTTGAFIREIEDVQLYTSTVPLIYDIQMTFSKFPPNVMLDKRCQEGVDGCIFPIAMRDYVEHISNTLQQITEDTLQTPRKKEINRGKRDLMDWNPLTLIGDWWSFCCGVASRRDLKGLQSNSEEVQQFMATLRKSVIITDQNLLTIKSSDELFRTNVTKIVGRIHDALDLLFHEQNNETLRETELEKKMHQLSMENGSFRKGFMQVFNHLSSITEILRYKDLQDHCRAQTISLLAVSPRQLAQDLGAIRRRIGADGYELVISDRNIARYYKMRIADCMFTSTGQTIYQLRIPIRRKEDDWKLYQMTNIPFGYKGSTCIIQHAPTLLAASQANLVTIQGTQLHQCQLDSGLCQIPQYNADPLSGFLCAERLLRGASVQELNDVCLFECLTDKSELSITQLDYHTFILTGAKEGMKLSCKRGTETYAVHPPNQNIGGLEIKLACGCELVIPGRMPIRPPYPCPIGLVETPHINIVIPAIMSKVDVLLKATQEKVRSESTLYPSLKAVFNESWDLSTPRLNLTEISKLKQTIVPELIHLSAPSTSTAVIIWNVLMTIAVALLLYKEFNRNGGYVLGIPMANQITGAAADSDHIHTHHTVNLTVTLFVLLTLMGALIATYIYFLLKKRKVEADSLLTEMNIEILGRVNQSKEVRLELANPNELGTPMVISLNTPETSRVIRALDRILEESEGDLEEVPLTKE